MTVFYPRMTFLVRRRRNEHRLPAQMLMQTQPTSGPLPTAAKCNRLNHTRPSSVVSRNYVLLWVARVWAGFAPGSEFRPVSLHTPGLATGRAGRRPMSGGHRSLRAGMPWKACPGPSSEAGQRSDEGPCPDARGGRPSTAAGSDAPARPFRGVQRAFTSRLARIPPKPPASPSLGLIA